MFFDKHGVDIVEQGGLLFAFGSFAPNIIEEDGKGANAEAVHPFEFLNKFLAVFIVPLDVHPWMNGPIEIDAPQFRTLVELLQLLRFTRGVRLAPVVAMIGVVLRPIDVDIHLVAAVEIELAEAVFMAPRLSVEALNRPSERHIRPVLERARFEFALGGHPAQGLHAVVEAALITTGNDDALRPHSHIVAFDLLRHQFLHFVHRLVAHDAEGNAEFGTRRQFYAQVAHSRESIRTCSGAIGSDAPLFGRFKESAGGGYALRDGRHVGHLCHCPHRQERKEGEREKSLFHGHHFEVFDAQMYSKMREKPKECSIFVDGTPFCLW